MVNSIYSSVKQISDTLFSSSGQAFRKALLVQWPHQGMWTIAFLTGRPGGDVANHLQGDYVSVYVPTTPNPTGGYFVVVARKDVIELDMSVDEALKYIISMGVVAAGRHGTGKCRQAMSMRTHYCGELNAALIGQRVSIAGWAHRRRDHGGVIFIDLRDREGLAQVVCDPDRAEAFERAEGVRNEFVLRVTGVVRARPAGTVNPNLRSGEIEVLAHEVEILNPSLTPPFQLDDDNLSETVRLEHRILDLRRDADAEEPAPAARRVAGRRAASSTATASSTSRRRCSTSRRPRARASSSCPRASTTASSTRCRRARSCSSRC